MTNSVFIQNKTKAQVVPSGQPNCGPNPPKPARVWAGQNINAEFGLTGSDLAEPDPNSPSLARFAILYLSRAHGKGLKNSGGNLLTLETLRRKWGIKDDNGGTRVMIATSNSDGGGQ